MKLQMIKFYLDGEIRSCRRPKSLNYSDLLELINTLYGCQTTESIESISCSLYRDDRLSFPIKNDTDLDQVLAVAKVIGSKKIFVVLKRRTSENSSNHLVADSSRIDQISSDKNDDARDDSPPPGTIILSNQRTLNLTSSPCEGGRFIPESSFEVASYASSHRSRTTRKSSIHQTSSSSNASGSSSLSQSANNTSDIPLNWKLGRSLGSGAFGRVFLCYDVDTGRELAVKQIPLIGSNSKGNRETKLFECELNIYKQIKHERIVRYFGAVFNDDHLQIFMEYMPGGSVREQIINYGPLPESLTQKYTRQILEGLIYLHENHFVHRDLKCANILRDISGNIKLADFGNAKQLTELTEQNKTNSGTIGTVHWTAPEIIQGNFLGRRADIWSLGCTIIEMLTSYPPWHHLQPIAAIFHIATCVKMDYQLPEITSKSTLDFVNLCLTKNYDQRPTATDLFKHSFVNDFLDV